MFILLKNLVSIAISFAVAAPPSLGFGSIHNVPSNLFANLPMDPSDPVFDTKFKALSQQEPEIPILQVNINKVYKAMRLLDNRENWAQAHDLLRQVLENSYGLNSEAISRLSAAKNMAAIAPIVSKIDSIRNARHEVFRFVAAKALLLEAIMLMRPKLNMTSDIEIKLVKQLFQTYFFPGHENEGKIVFPEPQTYSFELFTLNQDSLAKTETGLPDIDEAEDKRLPKDPIEQAKKTFNQLFQFIQTLRSLKDIPVSVANSDDSASDNNASPGTWNNSRRRETQRGYIMCDSEEGECVDIQNVMQQIIAGGGAAAIDSPEFRNQLLENLATDLKAIQERAKRNRYLRWSLLLQAVVDPQSVEYDDQLRDFVKRVRLAYHVTDKDNASSGDESSDNITLKETDLTKLNQVLVKENEYSGIMPVHGNESRGLYIISGITGPEVFRLRTFLYVKESIRSYQTATKIVQAISETDRAKALGETLGTLRKVFWVLIWVFYKKLLVMLRLLPGSLGKGLLRL